jgi:hypothetical protein
VKYLRELGSTWEACRRWPGAPDGLEALFGRIDVRGFRDVTLHLTDEALSNGFGVVLPERFGISVSGRGERI